MIKKILAVSVVFILSGCAKQWVNHNNPSADFYQDHAECMSQSGADYQPQVQAYNPGEGFGGGLAYGFNNMSAAIAAGQRQQMYNNCMNYHGWYLERAKRQKDQNDYTTQIIKKCNNGDAFSCGYLGSVYDKQGNYYKADEFYKKACDMGENKACGAYRGIKKDK